MGIFCLITKRRINLVSLILDFILDVVNVERKRHPTLLYGMFLTRVFIRAQLPLDGHRADNKRPITIMKTFLTLGLKPQATKKEKEEKKKDKKKKDSFDKKTHAQKEKTKSSSEEKKKRRRERSLYPILEERKTSKRRIMMLTEGSSSSSKVKDEVSTIRVEPINLVEPVVQQSTAKATRLA